MTMTAQSVTAARPSALAHGSAMQLAATEYDRVGAQLRSLTPADWTAPTVCPGWDVRALAAHMLGMVEMAASLREQRRQFRAAGVRAQSSGEVLIDALTGLQVDERAAMSGPAIADRYASRAPVAARARRHTPGFVRRRQLPVRQTVGDQQEDWTVGFLLDVILTRDPWMHRIDIARATGTQLTLTPEHDGVLVADVVGEWAARHARPFALRLTGPAGGEWSAGSGGADLEFEATEFCSILAGRGSADGLLTTLVPF